MDAADMRRMAGSASFGALSAGEGLALFDRALAGDDGAVVPAHLDSRVLRAEARAGSAAGAAARPDAHVIVDG